MAALAVSLTLAAATGCEPTNDTTTRPAFPTDASTGPSTAGLNEDALPSCGRDNTTWYVTTTRLIEKCRHTGNIRVQAPNVIIRNVVVRGTGTGVIIHNESTGLLVSRSIITSARPTNVAPCAASVGYGNYRLRASEVSGCADGVKVRGTVEIDGSFIHNTRRFCGTSCTHNDGMQSNDVAGRLDTINLTVTNSSFYMYSCTSNRILQAPNLTNSRITMTGNFFYGSHGLLNIDKEARTTNTGVVSYNTFAGSNTSGPFSASAGHTSPGLFTGAGVTNINRQGNVFENGAAVPTNGQMKPYTCRAA